MVPCSVCFPTYNGAAYLDEAIRSVLAQTFTDFELIIVDDQSTDDSAIIARSFDDPRLAFYQNPTRLGLVENWNRCLELAQGEYICIFHQDDVMLPNNLAAKVEALSQHPLAGLVYSDAEVIDGQGRIISDSWFFKTELEPGFSQNGLNFFKALIAAENIVCCPGVLVRKVCYEQLGGFDSRLPFTADWEMWLRIALFYDVIYLRKPLLQYRWHQSNQSQQFSGVAEIEQGLRAKLLVFEKYEARIPDSPVLKAGIFTYYENLAFDQAWYHYSRQQYREARPYLYFALKLQSLSGSAAVTPEQIPALLETMEQIWFRKVENLWRHDQLAGERTVQKIINSLTNVDIALTIPVRKLMEAVAYKMAFRLGWRK